MATDLKTVSPATAVESNIVLFGATSQSATAPTVYPLRVLVTTVDPRTYGAKFDGTTDDSSAIQAAINAAAGRLIVFPDKGVTKAKFTLGNYTRIEGNGCRVEWPSVGEAIVSVPSQGAIQTVEQSYIRNLNIDGVDTTSGSVGLAIGNHAAFWFEGVNVDRCDTGIRILSGQFDNGRSFRVRRCNVGLYMKSVYTAPGPGPGGGNSWSLHDGIFDQNKVSMLLYRDPAGNTPMHSNYLRNCLFMDSEITGLACFNVTHLTVDGGAPEYTGGGASTYTYDGLTIKTAAHYFYNSAVEFENYFVADGTMDPEFLLETGTVVSFNNLAGYGSMNGRLIDSDATSYAVFRGTYNCDAGIAHGVAKFDGVIISPQAAILSYGPPRRAPDLPNHITTSQKPGLTDWNGATAGSDGTDSVYGDYNQGTFAATVGSENSNRFNRSFTALGAHAAVAVTVQSSIDCTLNLQFFPNKASRNFRLKAGVWCRLFLKTYEVAAGAQYIVGNPKTTGGATIKLCKWQVYSGADSPELRSIFGQMASGYWQST